jgi:hypothetical protein
MGAVWQKELSGEAKNEAKVEAVMWVVPVLTVIPTDVSTSRPASAN